MVLIPHALAETRRAFDTVASSYADSNADNPVLSEMRRRAVAAVAARVPPGARLLDLGCGPGEDVERFARAGFRVTAIDWSPAMVEETRRRIGSAGLEGSVETHHLGIHELERLEARDFDAAYSNFGPLNCVPDLDASARAIFARLAPGGVFAGSIIGRFCPWEVVLYGLRRDWSRVRVRFSRDLVAVPFFGRTVWMRYYAPSDVLRSFRAAGFTRVLLRPLGLFLPPPYLTSFAKRHPAWIELLAGIERRWGGLPVIRGWGDHFLIVLRRS
jgi:SAM-dependent methyltransferase